MTKLYEVIRSVSRRSPPALNALVRRYFSAVDYDLWMLDQSDPYRNEEPEFRCANSPCTLGILREPGHYHANYVAACRELGISYKLVDIMRPDWARAVQEANCDAYLVWPSGSQHVWKELYDERLKVMVGELGLLIFPTYDELWLWESKRRMYYWAMAHGLPMPATHIFYNRDEALEFAETVELPVISKTDHGDTSRGVRILRTRREVVRHARRAFGRGIAMRSRRSGEKERGFVLFQEFIPDATEWRMLRIDESFFGHMKKKIGDFHSGSHTALEGEPPRELLDLTRRITDIKGFKSMGLDVLLSRDGRPHVTELQTIWGYTGDAKGLRPYGQLYAGRYKYNADHDDWVYEPGVFDENICCNLRVEYLVGQLLRRPASARVTR